MRLVGPIGAMARVGLRQGMVAFVALATVSKRPDLEVVAVAAKCEHARAVTFDRFVAQRRDHRGRGAGVGQEILPLMPGPQWASTVPGHLAEHDGPGRR